MHRLLPLLPLLVVPLLAVAAPVPKEKLTPEERLKKYWGKAVLPDDGCSTTVDGSHITLASAGGVRYEFIHDPARKGDAVRTEWAVSGDFDVRVQLGRASKPDFDARSPGR